MANRIGLLKRSVGADSGSAWASAGRALTVRPAVWCAPTNLTGRLGRISDGSGILSGKKDTAYSAGRRQCPKHLRVTKIPLS
ncbi:hypothetical protein AB6735_04025 [Mucilaginibacter sp. RCC_168]|uniref:hypothetical protein n=1 Tax=Mucilaginibacter sp. RCC_168 TaxID=3239221 RepID=UPI00352654E3